MVLPTAALDGEWIHAAWSDGDADVGTIYLNGEVDGPAANAPNGSGNLIVVEATGCRQLPWFSMMSPFGTKASAGINKSIGDGASPIEELMKIRMETVCLTYEEKFADPHLNGNESGPGP